MSGTQTFTLYVGGSPVMQEFRSGETAVAAPPGWTDTTGQNVTVPPPVPPTIAMWQAKAVLHGMAKVLAGPTLLDDANAIATAAGGAALAFWEYSPTINRSDALLSSLAGSLNLTSATLDSLFVAAATITL